MNKDLTVGSPRKVLWRFCLPLFASVIFQQLYNIADSLIVGKFNGENALAAVGNSYEITLIYIAFAFGINIGCSVVVSRFFGAKQYDDMKTAVYTTFISGGLVCALLMLIGFVLSPSMLRMIDTPTEIFDDSLLYLYIYTAGLMFMFLYNISTGVFSALGDSKTPFIFLAFSSVANIIMDLLFVAKFGLGVAGVAWATFICQGISCILAMITIFRRLALLNSEKAKLFSMEMLGKIAVVAIPSVLQQSFISVGNIIIQRVINGFGPSTTAGYAAAIKLNNMVITSFTTIGNGISNFTSQNIGAGKFKRIKDGLLSGLLLVYIICAPVVIIYLVFGRHMIMWFMKEDTAASLEIGYTFLKIAAPFYFMVATKLVADGVLRGASAMKLFMISTFSDLILRVVLAITLSKPMGSNGIWSSWPIGWSIGTALSVIFCIGVIRKYSLNLDKTLVSAKESKD